MQAISHDPCSPSGLSIRSQQTGPLQRTATPQSRFSSLSDLYIWAGDETDCGRLHLVLSYERDGPLPFNLNLLALHVGFAVLLVAVQMSFHEDGLDQVASSVLLGRPVV